MARKIYAVCDRRGVIEFADHVDEGLLPIGRGYPRKLREIVEVNARRAYQRGVLLVPGIPEAVDDNAALDAWERFRRLVEMRLAGQRGWPA